MKVKELGNHGRFPKDLARELSHVLDRQTGLIIGDFVAIVSGHVRGRFGIKSTTLGDREKHAYFFFERDGALIAQLGLGP